MWTTIASALGELIGPIFREILPLLYEIWRSPDDAKRIRSTQNQDATTRIVNDEWERMLEGLDVPDDYTADLRL